MDNENSIKVEDRYTSGERDIGSPSTKVFPAQPSKTCTQGERRRRRTLSQELTRIWSGGPGLKFTAEMPSDGGCTNSNCCSVIPSSAPNPKRRAKQRLEHHTPVKNPRVLENVGRKVPNQSMQIWASFPTLSLIPHLRPVSRYPHTCCSAPFALVLWLCMSHHRDQVPNFPTARCQPVSLSQSLPRATALAVFPPPCSTNFFVCVRLIFSLFTLNSINSQALPSWCLRGTFRALARR